jgi:hypothetical protein
MQGLGLENLKPQLCTELVEAWGIEVGAAHRGKPDGKSNKNKKWNADCRHAQHLKFKI